MAGSPDTKAEIARLREALEGGGVANVLRGGPSAPSLEPVPLTPAEIAHRAFSEAWWAIVLAILTYLSTALLALAGPYIAMLVLAISVWAGAGFVVAATFGALIGGGGVIGMIFVGVIALMILAVPAGVVAVATKVPFIAVAWAVSLGWRWTPPFMKFVMQNSIPLDR